VTSGRKNWLVLGGVALPAAAAAAAYLVVAGASDEHLNLTLRFSARASFMIYLLVFVARPLLQLTNSPWARWLARERRSLGIAFAAMHTVHLGLIAWRFGTIPSLDYPLANAAIGGTAYLLMYAMLITSFDGPARAIGPRHWRRLHKLGLYYIGFIFLSTLLPEPGVALYTFERAWFVALTGLAATIRLTAWLARARRTRGNDV
jgi:DMSO/TMAO reductase YedYZ heme-binding membrane subunit